MCDTTVTIDLSSGLLQNCVFDHNYAIDTFIALGAALLVRGGADITVANSTFNSNSVSGVTAGGGAVAVIEGSRVSFVSSSFTLNSASGNGPCTPGPTGSETRCPVSFGGALVASAGGEAHVSNTSFVRNSATCVNAFLTTCTAHGGALASAISGTAGGALATDVGLVCKLNRVECLTERNCIFGDGGCVYADSGRVELSRASITNNTVEGSGGGGGVFMTATAAGSLSESEISDNLGREGGGAFCKGQSWLNVSRSVLARNHAIMVAGAVAATEEASFWMMQSLFVNNTAGRISGVFG